MSAEPTPVLCAELHPYDEPGRRCTRPHGHEQPILWRVPFRIDGYTLIEAADAGAAEDVVWQRYLGEDDIADGDLESLLDRSHDLRVDVSGPVYRWPGGS